MPFKSQAQRAYMYAEHPELAKKWEKETSKRKKLPKKVKEDGDLIPLAESGIHIKPENKGKFTATKKRTGKTTEELTHSKNPLTRKRAIFAQNAKKWKHEDGGLPQAEFGMYEDEPAKLPSIQAAQLQPVTAASLAQPSARVDTNNLGASQSGAAKSVADSEKDSKDKNKMGMSRPKPIALGPLIQGGLGLINALLPQEQPRKVIDNTLAYNPYPQGTGSQALYEEGGVIMLEDPKPKKSKAQRKAKNTVIPDATYENKMSYNGIVDEQGRTIHDPTHQQWLETMIKYANNNTPESNVYRQNFQHHSVNFNTPSVPNDLPTFAEDGALIDPKPKKSRASRKAANTVIPEATYENNMNYNGIVDERGQVVHEPTQAQWLDTMIKYANNNTPESNVYRNNFQHHSINLNTPSVPNDIPTYAEDGARIQHTKAEGLRVIEGGKAPEISYNSIDGGMGEFKGASHEDDGIVATYNGKPFEAEGGEPYRIDSEGALEIFGNLKNPLTGNKFKKDAKVLAKKEKSAQKYIDLGTELVTSSPKSKDKFDVLKFNAGEVMMKGGLKKQEELVAAKENLSMLQEVMLKKKGEKQDYKDGGKMEEYPDGGKPGDPRPWEWRKTDKDRLDKKILKFVELVEKKGLEGYSGEKSGYDKRNTKSGRPSRHGTNQALDMMFKDPDVYDKIMKDPELASYLYNNGLTALNEYDPNVKNKTGATVGHLHIGFDKGTATADKFRQDYKALYKPNTNPNLVNTPQKSPFKGAVKTGDAYTEDLWMPEIKEPVSLRKKAPGTDLPEPTTPEFKQPEVTPFQAQRSGLPWNQIAPAIPQIFDTPDYVEAQYYNPELKTPYQVSFQDRVNQNARTFNAVATQGRANPEALSVLAAQQYSANDAILADEFRTNQGISNAITNENVGIINDAKLKNIQLADTQFTRQAQAKANTDANRIQAGIQIGDVLAKNALENKTMAVTQQLYKNYAYDKNMQLQYVGTENGADRITELPPTPASTQVTNVDPVTKARTTQKYVKPDWEITPVDVLSGYRNRARRSMKEDGGKLTQGKIAKLMFS